jgi:hypothetical protein
VLWKIDSISKDSKTLCLDFDLCSFCWVSREANSVAHALVKFASHQPGVFSCNFDSLPPFVIEAWVRDVALSI